MHPTSAPVRTIRPATRLVCAALALCVALPVLATTTTYEASDYEGSGSTSSMLRKSCQSMTWDTSDWTADFVCNWVIGSYEFTKTTTITVTDHLGCRAATATSGRLMRWGESDSDALSNVAGALSTTGRAYVVNGDCPGKTAQTVDFDVYFKRNKTGGVERK